MKYIKSVLITTLLFSLVACSSTYSVEELTKDQNKLQEVLVKCQTGKYKPDSQNCQNAAQASAKTIQSQFGIQ